ncbi:MAG: transposase [Bacteroidota bacterium]|jgi:REP element-mobilizing transposase RayT
MKIIKRHNRRSIRLKEYDYSQPGEYFITICTYNHEYTLGEIINSEMRLNEIGKIAEKCWKEISNHFMNVELDEFVVMPNHLHGIFTISEPVEYIQPNTKNVDVGVQNFEPLPQNTYQHIIPKSLGSIIRSYKAAVTHECRQCGYHDFRWQRNFYDRVIRNDNELDKIRDYILNNVLQWAFEKDNPDNIPLW